MTDRAKKQLQRRQKLPCNKTRKKLFLLLALALIFGSGAFLFHNERFLFLLEAVAWLKQNNQGEMLVSTPSALPRGDIYDRNFRTLAATYESYAIYARPLEMEDPAAVADILENILGLEQNNLLASFKSERGFVWIAEGIDQKLADSVKEQNIRGIYQVAETKRFYPNYATAAHAVGFVENDQGLDGIEFHYNSLLRGEGINTAELEKLHFDPATAVGRNSSHLVLNLDLMLQSKIERFLEKRVRSTGAVKGAALLMDADTGGILAMASYPAFNPNRYWEFSSVALNNHVVTEPVYPGELSLVFQQAAAINFANEKQSEAVGTADAAPALRVIEPEILKRRKLSVAPRIDSVDPEYLDRFIRLLGFGQKPATDIPLKDETSVSSLPITDPAFHTSSLRLLTGFTAIMNNGRIVTPHLLHRAYPKDDPAPLEPNLSEAGQTAALHPETTRDLTDFLAAKWLKITHRGRASSTPMFFEAHRFQTPAANDADAREHNETAEVLEMAPRITQSVMLGAIPGRDPQLTMIALLSYPEDTGDAVYPEALEAYGHKISILSPDQDMIQKMLSVAELQPPVPSPDFWSNGGTLLAQNRDPLSPANGRAADAPADSRKNMPDVTGKSLRAGLQVLQHYNLDIKLVGSGRIVAQRPSAGTELKNNTECVLEMQQEI